MSEPRFHPSKKQTSTSPQRSARSMMVSCIAGHPPTKGLMSEKHLPCSALSSTYESRSARIQNTACCFETNYALALIFIIIIILKGHNIMIWKEQHTVHLTDDQRSFLRLTRHGNHASTTDMTSCSMPIKLITKLLRSSGATHNLSSNPKIVFTGP